MNFNSFVKSLIGVLLVALCGIADIHAQGYLTDVTTGNAILTRDPARQASTEIDAVITNPAGVMFMKNGFHASVSGIFSFQDISSHLNAEGGVTYRNHDISILPAIQFAYKQDKWAVSASFSSAGGFGKRKMNNGSIADNLIYDYAMSEEMEELNNNFRDVNFNMLTLALRNDIPLPDIKTEDKYSYLTNSMTKTLYNWRIQLGGNYKFTDNFSAYVGVKANHVVCDNKIPFSLQIFRPSTGEKWSVGEYSQRWIYVSDNLDVSESDKNAMREIVEKLANEAEKSTVDIDIKRNGWGFAPIIGLDYKINNFNFGVKYEFESRVNVEKSDSHYKLPSILSVGADWQISNKVKVAAGSNILFGTDDNAFSDKGTSCVYDISGSGTYIFNNKFLISGGYTYSRQNKICSDYSSTVVNPYSNHRVSIGAAYSPMEALQINLGVSSDVSNLSCQVNYVGIEPPFSVIYKYDPLIRVALGVSYHF